MSNIKDPIIIVDINSVVNETTVLYLIKTLSGGYAFVRDVDGCMTRRELPWKLTRKPETAVIMPETLATTPKDERGIWVGLLTERPTSSNQTHELRTHAKFIAGTYNDLPSDIQ